MSDQSLNEKGRMPKKFSVKSGDKSKAGGLTAKGVKRYRAANPGSKLKTAVTTKPSKLKKGSKSANRRKSFCARMGGMKKRLTSAKTARDPNSRINKALRKWNCSTEVNPNTLQRFSEMVTEGFKDKLKYHAKEFGQGFMDGLKGRKQIDRRAKALARERDPERQRRRRMAAAQKNQAEKDKEDFNKLFKESLNNARLNLAEKCWVGWTQKGLKKKGNRMVPNCVKEGDDPRMKTTPASIQQAGGDPDVYKKEKARKDPKPKSKKASPARRDTLGRSGGKFRRERIQPAKGAEGPSAPTRQAPAKSDVKGGKENFKKGTAEKPMSRKDVNKMGVRGQESKIAAKKRAMGKKTRAANIQLMKDMGVLKFDKQGRRIRK